MREQVAIVGAGTMGHGIAYVALLAGHPVAMADASPDTLEQAVIRITAAFQRGVEKGKVSDADRHAALARLRAAPDIADAARAAAIVVEAIPEKLVLKRELFAMLEQCAPPVALFGTNTSSLSVTEIAQGLAHPERVVGTHFFNPVPAMKLVELVRGAATSDETLARARAFAEGLGKTAIVVRDTPGFATSRLGVTLGLEAIRMLEQGVASAEDIDRAMELGYNHPVGPLRLSDLVGLDVRLAIADHLHETLGDDTYRAPELMRRLVAEGKLGKKSGEGFYRWEDEA